MIRKAFDLEKALAGSHVITRDGREVTGFHQFKTSEVDFPVYGVLDDAVHKWTTEGIWAFDVEGPNDLFMAPVPVTEYAAVRVNGLQSILSKCLQDAIDYNSGSDVVSIAKIISINGEITDVETVHRYTP